MKKFFVVLAIINAALAGYTFYGSYSMEGLAEGMIVGFLGATSLVSMALAFDKGDR